MEINLRHLCAINKYGASKEETRYYLNGVFCHTSEDRQWVHFVATDGHRMIVHRVPNADNVDWSFIIPRTMLERFKFSARDRGFADLSFLDGRVTIQHAGSSSSELPVDGTFPDYVRIRPVDNGEILPAAFNGQYCADFDALAKVFGAVATITPRGDSPALVTFGRDDLYGALMPKLKTLFEAKAPF